MKNFYEVLGVSQSSESEVIAAAYKAMMRKYHPDTNKSASAEKKAKEINEAFEVLKNAVSRREHDAELKRAAARNAAPPSPPPSPPPPTPSPSVFYQAAVERGARWVEAKPNFVVGLSLTILMLSVGYFAYRQPSQNHDAATAVSAFPDAEDREIVMPEPSITPKIVDLNQALKFDSPSECIATGTLEKVYSKLDSAMVAGTSGLSVKLDEFDRPLPVDASSDTDFDGVKTAESSVRFPENTEWNGLKLSRIKAYRYIPPDTDSIYTRYIMFLDPPEKVIAVLDRLQFSAKMAPDFKELLGTYNSCGGAMQLKAVPGGSSLSCVWGC